ncbi:hypothetical protein SRB17_89860 [Streptomyces sp. RB17]|nr:hypothetical protein [Streptomyces sp. RB17]
MTPYELVAHPSAEPGRGQVHFAVEARGVCRSDAFAGENLLGVHDGAVPTIPDLRVVLRMSWPSAVQRTREAGRGT